MSDADRVVAGLERAKETIREVYHSLMTDDEVLAAWNAERQLCYCEACIRIDPSRLSVVPSPAAPEATRTTSGDQA